MSVQSLADALLSAAQQRGEDSPTVRGGDWQMATVTAVGADGTVDCGPAIRARRLETYTTPLVGDLVVLLRSGTGNWLVVGRAETNPGAWQPLALASGYGHPGHGAVASYLVEGRRVYLRGRIGPTTAGATIPNNVTVATLPAAIRPYGGGVAFGWASPRNAINTAPSLTRAEITDTGVLRIFESFSPPSWISLDGVSYHI